MQDPVCIHTCFEVSVKLQGEAEEGGKGEMEELTPRQCRCQPRQPVGITGSLQSRGEARFFVSSANEADTGCFSFNQSDHRAEPKLIHSRENGKGDRLVTLTNGELSQQPAAASTAAAPRPARLILHHPPQPRRSGEVLQADKAGVICCRKCRRVARGWDRPGILQ